MREAHRVGITPYLLQLAAKYVCRGLGTHYPKGASLYSKIVVREIMPWQSGETLTASTLILSVDFYDGDDRKVRWIEFAVCPAGFGGEAIIKQVL